MLRTTGTEYLPVCSTIFGGCFFAAAFVFVGTPDSIASLAIRFNGKTAIPAVTLVHARSLTIAIDGLDAQRSEFR